MPELFVTAVFEAYGMRCGAPFLSNRFNPASIFVSDNKDWIPAFAGMTLLPH